MFLTADALYRLRKNMKALFRRHKRHKNAISGSPPSPTVPVTADTKNLGRSSQSMSTSPTTTAASELPSIAVAKTGSHSDASTGTAGSAHYFTTVSPPLTSNPITIPVKHAQQESPVSTYSSTSPTDTRPVQWSDQRWPVSDDANMHTAGLVDSRNASTDSATPRTPSTAADATRAARETAVMGCQEGTPSIVMIDAHPSVSVVTASQSPSREHLPSAGPPAVVLSPDPPSAPSRDQQVPTKSQTTKAVQQSTVRHEADDSRLTARSAPASESVAKRDPSPMPGMQATSGPLQDFWG